MFDIVNTRDGKQTIFLTRGDYGGFHINIFDKSGTPYVLEDGDVVEFTVRKRTTSKEALIHKVGIDIDIEGVDTQSLHYGKYVYDVQMTHINGRRDTFIGPAEFRVLEEVTFCYTDASPIVGGTMPELSGTAAIATEGHYLTGYLTNDVNPFDLVFEDPNNDGNIIVTRKPKEDDA